jgi:predicted  nucleic acid-binding Zn-ribbon protein
MKLANLKLVCRKESMMSSARQLYELQIVEQKLSRGREALSAARASLADRGVLDGERIAFEDTNRILAAARAEQRDLELAIETLDGRIKGMKERLFGGKTTNSRELSGMQQDLDMLHRQKASQEELLLDVLVRAEEIESRCQPAKEQFRNMERERWREEETLHLEEQRLEGEIKELQIQLQVAQAGLEGRDLKLYEMLKESRGLAVALVERDQCNGCRMTIPSHELQRARKSRIPIRCSNCSRVLYVG